MSSSPAALVLLSGGQDSTTCLVWALERYAHVETIGFDYGQRNAVELDCRARVLGELKRAFPRWAAKLGEDRVVDLGVIGRISDTALTRESEIAMGENGLPTTFVPGRNLLFFTVAAAVAYRRGLKALQVALSLGMDRRFVIEAPLMWLDKAATWRMAEALGGAALVELIREHTHSCYRGERGTRRAWGYGCGACPACELRARGFEKYSAR